MSEAAEQPQHSQEASPLDLLPLGLRMTRVQAQAVLDVGAGAVAAIEAQLERADASDEAVRGALILAGLVGDRALVPALLRVLDGRREADAHAPSYVRSVESETIDALRRIGLPALQPLLDLVQGHAESPVVPHALQALAALATDHPERAGEIAARLIETLLATPSPGVAAAATKALAALDWRDALPAIERTFNQGRIDDSLVSAEEIERWRRGTGRRKVAPLSEDPLAAFTPPHRAAFEQYRAQLSALRPPAALEDMREAFTRDLVALRQAPPEKPQRKVGRNEPCPCGSGKKYKKCHLDRDATGASRTRLRARVAAAAWVPVGYAMLPAEQMERVELRDLEAHLDLLAAEPESVLEMLPAEPDDYRMWAAAVRVREAKPAAFVHIAAIIASSDDRHRALDYEAITALALTAPAPYHLPFEVQDLLFDLALREQDLGRAWDLADHMVFHDFETARTWHERLLEEAPDDPWVAAGLAHATSIMLDPFVLEVLDQAIERVTNGTARRHPRLPDVPCPLEVLQAYRAEAAEFLASLEDMPDTGLSEEDALSETFLERRDALRLELLDLERRLRTDLEDLEQSCAPADLPAIRERRLKGYEERRADLIRRCREFSELVLGGAGRAEAESPLPVLWAVADEAPDITRVFWVLPVEARSLDAASLECLEGAQSPADLQASAFPEPPAGILATCLRAVARVLGSVPPEASSLAFGPWGRFMAIQVRLGLELDGLGRMSAQALEQALDEGGSSVRLLALVPVPFAFVESMGSAPQREAFEVRLEVPSPSAAKNMVAEKG